MLQKAAQAVINRMLSRKYQLGTSEQKWASSKCYIEVLYRVLGCHTVLYAEEKPHANKVE